MIVVLDPGPLTSVQDPIGRPGWRRHGVPVGGAVDAWSARLANRLIGNDEAAAMLEVTLGGLEMRAEASILVAVTGGLAAAADGRTIAPATAARLRAGQILRLAAGTGARGYVAFGGGIDVAAVLGSASTELRTGFGGHEGRALRVGDRLTLGPARTPRLARWTGRREDGPIRIVPGPSPGFDLLAASPWSVGPEADRTGIRLDGEPRRIGGEVPSMGLPLGAIQVPPDERPIIMLADRPVTGGYRVPACVIAADVGRVAQLWTHDAVRFASVSPAQAREAWLASEADLAVEPIEDDAGWAGAHR